MCTDGDVRGGGEGVRGRRPMVDFHSSQILGEGVGEYYNN